MVEFNPLNSIRHVISFNYIIRLFIVDALRGNQDRPLASSQGAYEQGLKKNGGRKLFLAFVLPSVQLMAQNKN